MRFSPIKTSFNAGEWSPLMHGRVDMDKYASACDTMENMLPLVQGAATRRAGTMFISEVFDSTKQTWLAKFEFNYQQAYILEFSPGKLRFYTNYGIVVTAPNTPLVVNTPYMAADLTNPDGTFGLSMIQSNDIIFIAAANFPPYQLIRTNNTTWTLAPILFLPEPFGDAQNVVNNGVTVSVQPSAGQVVASAGIFTPNMAGRQMYVAQPNNLNFISQWQSNTPYADQYIFNGNNHYLGQTGSTVNSGFVGPVNTLAGSYQTDGNPGKTWLFINSGFLYISLTSYVSPTTMNFSFPAQNGSIGALGSNLYNQATNNWAFSAWNGGQYPTNVTFFRERLVFARGQQIWFSVVGQFYNFAYNQFGQVTTDSAISVSIQSDDTSQITYMIPTAKGLIVGTTAGECIISEAAITLPFGPDNVKISQLSSYGGKTINPIRVDETVMFIQRSGKKVRESSFNFETEAFKANNATVMAEHVTGEGVVDMVMQREPYSIIWLVRDDGQLIGMTYNKEQDTIAFHRHLIANQNFIVESINSIPAPNGEYDDLWMVGRITINGQLKRYVMVMQQVWDPEIQTQQQMFYVDCGATYNSVPTTTISGLSYLQGLTVQVLANGAVHPDCKVSDTGTITLNYPVTYANIGLFYQPLLRTMRIEGGSQDGTAQGKFKRFSRFVIRVFETLGVMVGCPPSNDLYNLSYYDNIIFRNPNNLMNNPLPVPTYTEDFFLNINDDYTRGGRIAFTQSQPLAMTILSIMPQAVTEDEG